MNDMMCKVDVPEDTTANTITSIRNVLAEHLNQIQRIDTFIYGGGNCKQAEDSHPATCMMDDIRSILEITELTCKLTGDIMRRLGV